MSITALTRLAAVLVLAEGLGLILLGGRQIVAIAGGDTDSLVSALALLVMTVLGALALIAFGAAIWRGRSWGRSGGIVAQVLVIAVAIGAATGQDAALGVAAALAVPAVAILALLILVIARSPRERG